MSKYRSLISGLFAAISLMGAVWFSRAEVSAPTNSPDPKTVAEGVVHTPPHSGKLGQPKTADENNFGTVSLTVVDESTKLPVFCRVNVIGSDGNFYEPDKHSLKPWSLHRLGNRRGKGPIRYYGWFFYSNGQCKVRVPPGTTRIEIFKGFEFTPVSQKVVVKKGENTQAVLKIRRTVNMAAHGWFSGDTHIHLNRRNRTDDRRALELAAAEDIQFSHILAMNDPRFYKPTMGDQIWPQQFGLGKKSSRFMKSGSDWYGISSGQEYRCGTFGHICLVGHSRLVQADGLKTNPNNWPVFGLVSDETRSLGGYAFHAHGGYEKEIYADFAQRATTGVELLQFAVYRGIALEGWYHILNAGFRFPAVGASDYPYCRALGDCRTYVFLGKNTGGGQGSAHPTFAQWDKAAAEGRSFFTTGPLLMVSVAGKQPGETVRWNRGEHNLTVNVRMQSPVADVDEIHVISLGKVVARKRLKASENRGPVRWTVRLPVKESTWIAVRAFAKNAQTGREDTEAHTNPVYVEIDGKKPFQAESVRWLLKKLNARIEYHAKRKFAEKKQVLAYFEKSRAVLQKMLKP
ncbi:MAG: hypothetical protein Tsb009_07540 [Planctomycetaceae bacterium]